MTDNEVIRLETDLLDPARRADRDYLDRVLHREFEEFGVGSDVGRLAGPLPPGDGPTKDGPPGDKTPGLNSWTYSES